MMEILIGQGPPPPPPPSVPIPGLNHVPSLLITVALWGIVFFLIYLTQFRRKTFTIRKIAALDAIEESIGRSVEMGKAVFLNASGVRPVGDIGISIFSIIHYVGRASARLNGKLQVFLQAQEIEGGILIEDNLRQAFSIEGKHFDRKEIMRYEAVGLDRLLITLFYTEHPSTYLRFGSNFPPSMMQEELNRAGIYTIIGGQADWHNSVFYDHSVIGEELIAAGAYLSNDPTLITSIVSSDIIQYVLMGSILVIASAELLGFKVIAQLTDFWVKA